jgi:hypothetical protein
MNKFKTIVQNTIIIFVSREFAFLYCVFGAMAQVAHTYYLTVHISSLTGYNKVLQAVVLSIFISTSLLYFTSVSTNEKTDSAKRVRQAVTLFMIIEILINCYYYSRHLLLENYNNGLGNIILNNWFDFVFAVLISCMIPVTLKLYSTHIRAKEWVDEMNAPVVIEQDTNYVKIDELEKIHNRLDRNDEIFNSNIDIFNNKLDNKLREFEDNVDSSIKDSFEKNSTLFINQYKNKIQNLSQ